MILKIREPNASELDSIQNGSTLISLVNPAQNQDLVNRLNEKKITTFALDQVPRVTIAQACDVLSSQERLSVIVYHSKKWPKIIGHIIWLI